MGAHALRERVYRANMALSETGLVIETFGNVSGADHDAGLMAIKPSGVPYQKLTTADMVLVEIETGRVVDSTLRPSSDTPTHLELYRAFRCGGIVHPHSKFVAAFEQNEVESKPISFYTWSEDLKRTFRFLRYLMHGWENRQGAPDQMLVSTEPGCRLFEVTPVPSRRRASSAAKSTLHSFEREYARMIE